MATTTTVIETRFLVRTLAQVGRVCQSLDQALGLVWRCREAQGSTSWHRANNLLQEVLGAAALNVIMQGFNPCTLRVGPDELVYKTGSGISLTVLRADVRPDLWRVEIHIPRTRNRSVSLALCRSPGGWKEVYPTPVAWGTSRKEYRQALLLLQHA